MTEFIIKGLENALEQAEKVANDTRVSGKARIINTSNWLGHYQAYMEMLEHIDTTLFVEMMDKTSKRADAVINKTW